MNKTHPLPRNLARWRLALLNVGLPFVVLLVLLAAGALWAAWRVLDPTPDKRLVIATGPEQGAYDTFAKRYLPLLQAQGVSVTLRRTRGSVENLALLRDPASDVQVAFVQGGVEADASADAVPLASLGSVAVEPLWLFYREPSMDRLARRGPPDNLAQLAAWRIDIGPAGGGSDELMRQLAAASGLQPTRMLTSDAEPVQRVLSLVQDRIDALALVSAADAPLLQYLLQTPGVRLFDFAQADAYSLRFAYLRPLVLPRGVIDLAADRPAQDLRLVAPTTSLIARADLHPALTQLLLQAAQHAHAEPGWFNRRGEFPNAGTYTLPLASEAARYYRSGPPWLQQYLPFWLANFVDRMWIVLLPLLAAMLPLSRIVPPLVTMRLRSRVYRWYANLRAIEQELERAEPDYEALRDELKRLDALTDRIGVPLSFTHELYELRAHIQLVRRRLQARSAGEAAAQPAVA